MRQCDAGGLANSPCWGWDRPLPTTARPSVWSDFKTGPRQFRHTFRRYRRHLNREEREQAMSHIRDLARIVSKLGFTHNLEKV